MCSRSYFHITDAMECIHHHPPIVPFALYIFMQLWVDDRHEEESKPIFSTLSVLKSIQFFLYLRALHFQCRKKIQQKKPINNNIYLCANRCFKTRRFIQRKLKLENREKKTLKLCLHLSKYLYNFEWTKTKIEFDRWPQSLEYEPIHFFLLVVKKFEWIVN